MRHFFNRLRFSGRASVRRKSRLARLAQTRRGSTLLVVMALMGMLSVLGVVYFLYATQEEESAKNFHEAAKQIHDPELDPDVYFDWMLRQVINGPGPLERNSVLYGGRNSLLPNAYGQDAHPHNGAAMRVFQTRTPVDPSLPLTSLSIPMVDIDGDGTQDFLDINNNSTISEDDDNNVANDLPESLLRINRSPAASVIVPDPSDLTQNYFYAPPIDAFPDPDVDYTYPDINNVWLSYSGFTVINEFTLGRDVNQNSMVDPPYQVRVLKPSFWRPEILQRAETGTSDEDANGDGKWDPVTEDANGNGLYDASDLNHDGSSDNIARFDPTWYWAAWSRGRVMRPHPEHYFIPTDSQIPPTVKRYLNDSDPTDAGVIATLPGNSKGFPFAGRRDPLDQTKLTALSPGVWNGYQQANTPIEFDADADGDNIYEAILMDLDFPVQERPSDGALYVPLFAATIYDLDALINLNAAGNLAGDTTDGLYFGDGQANLTTYSGQYKSISKSLQGITPYEVNPFWSLDADPTTLTSTTDYSTYFGHAPADRWELANMEFWWANKGRVEYGGSLPEVHTGRMGDADRVWQILQASLTAGASPISYNNPFNANPTVSFFPFPGTWDRDDNRNSNLGGAGNQANGQTLAFQHPISFSGRGRLSSAGSLKLPNLVQPMGGNPSQWTRYSDFGVAGSPAWAGYLSGALMQNTYYGSMFVSPGQDGDYNTQADNFYMDDLTELTLEPRSLKRPADEVFSYQDLALLHMSKSDIDNVGVYSRLREVFPANINPSDATLEANERRRRFTTASWDRKQYSFPHITGSTDGSPGQPGVDDNRNGLVDDPGELGWPGTNDKRSWEFGADTDQDGRLEFPPQFGSVQPYVGIATGKLPTVPQDPFRPQLRRLLEVEHRNRDQLKLQFRLSVNQVLDVIRTPNVPGNPRTSPLEFRPLTPHSTDFNNVSKLPTITAGGDLPPMPPAAWNGRSVEEVREFWAQYDRQQMARDIYVLLYTTCGGNDLDLTQTVGSGSNAFTQDVLNQIAQFAVNLVDSLDPDNVMTVFEYDTDLQDGWDLDDQPWTDDGGDRAVVIGVEAQELTFSETLWAYQAKYGGGATDNSATLYDETTQNFHFLFMELRSVAPKNVDLASSVSTSRPTATWRVSRRDIPSSASPFNVSVDEDLNGNGSLDGNEDSLGNGNGILDIPKWQTTASATGFSPRNDAIYFKSSGANTVSPGGLFTIATSDNYSGGKSSSLYVDNNLDGMFDGIAPNPLASVMAISDLTPGADLDLTASTHTSRFELESSTTPGNFLSDATAPSNPNVDFRTVLILERRLHPGLPKLPLSENPWVTVDAITVERQPFGLLDTHTTAAQVQAQLANLISTERDEPLTSQLEQEVHPGGGNFAYNSLSRNNSNSASVFPTVQRHLDRDFASVVELLSLPVVGPLSIARGVSDMNLKPSDEYNVSAASIFLVPDPPPPTSGGGGPPAFPGKGNGPPTWANGAGSSRSRVSRFANHWHRLFGFIEVPTRTHLQLGKPLEITRVPGRLNPNTMRHPEVMAALIDNPDVFSPTERRWEDTNHNGSLDAGEDANANGALDNDDFNGNTFQDFGLPGIAGNDSSHDWWLDMLTSRDGLHPETGLVLPGTPAILASGSSTQVAGSRPFRDLGLVTASSDLDDSLESSIFRSHPTSKAASESRMLFDLGTSAEANTGTLSGGQRFEPHIRQQILSKIAGNTTTRSNVFVVFISVQFHEAYEDPTSGAIRIGGRIDLNSDGKRDDGHRGFFIVDRSAAEDAYDPRTGTFDWRVLVKHRLTIN